MRYEDQNTQKRGDRRPFIACALNYFFSKGTLEALHKFRPVYAGAHRVNGLAVPEDRTQVVKESDPIGRARECVFRQFSLAP